MDLVELQPAEAKAPLRVLMLEDRADDAELNERELRKAGLNFTALRVADREAFARALVEFRPDLLISDYDLPAFDGSEALQLVRAWDAELPVIFVSGALGDEAAAKLVQLGASD